METVVETVKDFIMPGVILIVGSLARFLLWNNAAKKFKDWGVFIVFGIFLMMIIEYSIRLEVGLFPATEDVANSLRPLAYSFSALVAKEVLEILIQKLPAQIADRILGNNIVTREIKKD